MSVKRSLSHPALQCRCQYLALQAEAQRRNGGPTTCTEGLRASLSIMVWFVAEVLLLGMISPGLGTRVIPITMVSSTRVC
jgi:hypothetical protein